MLLTRITVGLSLAPIALLIVFYGGWPYFVTMAAILTVGALEYGNMMSQLDWNVPVWLIVATVLLLMLNSQLAAAAYSGPILMAVLFLSLGWAIWHYERGLSDHPAANWLATVGGILLIGWLGQHFILLRMLDERGESMMLVMVSVWAADTFAYFVGSRFGRHPLTPRVSPKKSIEGYLAGIALGVGMVVPMRLWLFPSLPLLPSLIVATILTAITPLGDLGISILKREAGVKDSGTVFPGHGGVLDRFDTLLWGVALAYYLLPFVFGG